LGASLIISSRISSSARFLLCGSIVSVKYRHLYFNYGRYMEQYRHLIIWNNI
jgi:hypothetical protein